MQLFLLGTPVEVTVDDYLPFDIDHPYKLLYSLISFDKAVWFPLLEKAAAFTGATKLLAVPDVLGPLLPLVPVSTRGFESRFALLRLPTLPLLRFGSLLR